MKVFLLFFSLVALACQPVEQSSEEGSQNSSNAYVSYACELADVANLQNLNEPNSIAELTALVNALPKPLSLPCFIRSLARPLSVSLTSSTLSAQAALGEENPRIFLFSQNNLILSLVPTGGADKFLEISELVSDTRSIKAELEFPIMNNITESEAYAHVATEQGMSKCATCHSGEQVEGQINGTNIYSSAAAKPNPGKEVNIDDFWQEYYLCDLHQVKSSRCDLISAIYTGNPQSGVFPSNTPSFFETLGL